MTPHRFRSKQFQDCASILPAEMCEELERRKQLTRDSQPNVQPGLYSIRGGSEKIAPGALVIRGYGMRNKFEGYYLPSGWTPKGSKRFAKRALGRFALMWKRDGEYLIQLLYNGLAFVRSDWKSRFQNVVEAIHTCEMFLADTDGGEFVAIREGGREVKKSRGEKMLSQNETPNLRKIIRASTIGVERARERARAGVKRQAPTLTPVMRRLNVAPEQRVKKVKPLRERKVLDSPLDVSEQLRSAIAAAVAGITGEIESLKAQLENVNVLDVGGNISPGYPDYTVLSRGGRTRLIPRSRPNTPTRSHMVVRAIPNSHNAGSGRQNVGETIHSRCRRSSGLSIYQPPIKYLSGYRVPEAMAISQMQVDQAYARVAMNPVGQRIVGGFKSLNGLSFPTREARDRYDQSTDVRNQRLIPLERPLTANEKRMIPLGEL